MVPRLSFDFPSSIGADDVRPSFSVPPPSVSRSSEFGGLNADSFRRGLSCLAQSLHLRPKDRKIVSSPSLSRDLGAAPLARSILVLELEQLPPQLGS